MFNTMRYLEDPVGDLASSPQPIEIKVFHDDEATCKAVAHRIEDWLPKEVFRRPLLLRLHRNWGTGYLTSKLGYNSGR
jgi:hypothetical protein